MGRRCRRLAPTRPVTKLWDSHGGNSSCSGTRSWASFTVAIASRELGRFDSAPSGTGPWSDLSRLPMESELKAPD